MKPDPHLGEALGPLPARAGSGAPRGAAAAPPEPHARGRRRVHATVKAMSALLLLLLVGCDSAPPPYTCADGTAPTDWFRDDDGDGYGRADRVRPACEAPEGFVATGGDCLDDDTASHPDAEERCDELDNDCDGAVDEDVAEPSVWHGDFDADGFGDAATVLAQCDPPAGYVADATDCDDGDADVHPGAEEFCDDLDQDCDGVPDDADSVDALAWHPDADGDGYGDVATAVVACVSPEWLLDANDCDDADPEVHPGVPETCDDADRNCDGDPYADATDPVRWYGDVDADGYGGPTHVDACVAPDGYVAVSGDCDDYHAAKHPGAPEYCDVVDHDCDGDTWDDDSVDASTFYVDADGDGYGDPASTQSACFVRAGLSASAADCDDADATFHPNAPEACDGVDHDCDGAVDEPDSVDAPTWYADADGDGFGDATAPLVACSAPVDTVAEACDCDDTDAAYNPDGLDCIEVSCVGGEVYLDDRCGLREVSATLGGTAGAPATLTLTEPTTVTFCAGTHYVAIDAAADVSLVGPDGADLTSLDLADAAGITFTGALAIDGLTLRGAYATFGGAAIDGAGSLVLASSVIAESELEGSSGAIVAVDGSVDLVDSEVRDNLAGYAPAASATCQLAVLSATGDVTLDGASFADNQLACEVSAGLYAASELRGSVVRVGGDLTATDSRFTGNTARAYSAGMSAVIDGGVAAWVDGDARFTGSEVSGNSVEAALDCAWSTCERAAYGAGLRVDGDATFADSLVADNTASASGTDGWGTPTLRTYGGGLYLGGSLLCSSTGGDHGFRGNTASAGGGVYWSPGSSAATLTSAGCDWGVTSDNTPDDLAGAASWSGGDDERFTCDAAGSCAP